MVLILAPLRSAGGEHHRRCWNFPAPVLVLISTPYFQNPDNPGFLLQNQNLVQTRSTDPSFEETSTDFYQTKYAFFHLKTGKSIETGEIRRCGTSHLVTSQLVDVTRFSTYWCHPLPHRVAVFPHFGSGWLPFGAGKQTWCPHWC